MSVQLNESTQESEPAEAVDAEAHELPPWEWMAVIERQRRRIRELEVAIADFLHHQDHLRFKLRQVEKANEGN